MNPGLRSFPSAGDFINGEPLVMDDVASIGMCGQLYAVLKTDEDRRGLVNGNGRDLNRYFFFESTIGPFNFQEEMAVLSWCHSDLLGVLGKGMAVISMLRPDNMGC